MAKWKKNKPVFEEAQFYEAIQFMPENYSVPDPQQEGQNKMEQPQESQEQQQDQEQVSRAREREREREDAAKLQSQQQQKQGPKGYRAARQRNNSVPNHNKDSIVAVSLPPAAHFLGFTPSLVARPGAQTSPPWPNSPLAMPEDFQYPLPPPPPPADGCVYMPIGGFAPHPTMPGPHPLLPLPPLTTQANMGKSKSLSKGSLCNESIICSCFCCRRGAKALHADERGRPALGRWDFEILLQYGRRYASADDPPAHAGGTGRHWLQFPAGHSREGGGSPRGRSHSASNSGCWEWRSHRAPVPGEEQLEAPVPTTDWEVSRQAAGAVA